MKKTIWSTAAFLCFSVIVFSQEKINLEMMQKIRDEERSSSRITMIAHNITDGCGARLTNSPGYKRALDWITHTFKEWGLQNAGPEAGGEFGKGWSTEESYLAMKVPYYQALIANPVAWTMGTEKNISAEVILLDKLDSNL